MQHGVGGRCCHEAHIVMQRSRQYNVTEVTFDLLPGLQAGKGTHSCKGSRISIPQLFIQEQADRGCTRAGSHKHQQVGSNKSTKAHQKQQESIPSTFSAKHWCCPRFAILTLSGPDPPSFHVLGLSALKRDVSRTRRGVPSQASTALPVTRAASRVLHQAQTAKQGPKNRLVSCILPSQCTSHL